MSAATTRVRWLGRRLRAMPPDEIAARVRRTVRHQTDDALWRAAPAQWQARWEPPAEVGAVPAPRGLITRDRAAALGELCPGEPERTVQRADRFLQGRVQFFGYPEVRLPVPIDYRFDPHAGMRWPDRHGKQIDYRHIAGGDPKWIWELNRCQELPVLAQAWLLTGDDRYAAGVRDEAIRWGEQNPPGRGIAWANGYEAGVRAISLALTFAALRDEGGPLRDADRDAFLRLLWQHGRWIGRDPSTHSSANNHRLGELAGLVVMGALVPEVPMAGRWLEAALAALAGHADRQILADGIGAELAFTYHLYVLELLLVVVAALDAAGLAVPGALTGALERSGHALWAQLGPGEPQPTYGDTDEAVAVRLGADELRDVRSICCGIAARTGSREARALAPRIDALTWWLFGPDGRSRFDATPPAGPPGDVLLPDGGLAILRRGGSRVIMDVGPLGYLSLAAHGHADALAIAVASEGRELVVDPGTGSYFRSQPMREAFRSTAFHATVEVDGQSQSVPGGAFLWTRHAEVRLRGLDLPAGTVWAGHDGFEALEDPVTHTRGLAVLEDGVVLVVDRLTATRHHDYRHAWPFAPDLTVRVEGADGFVGDLGGDAALRIRFSANHPYALELLRGREDPPAGWWSSGLERWQPAWHGRLDLAADGPVQMASLLCFGPAVAEEASVAVRADGETAVVEAAYGARRHTARLGATGFAVVAGTPRDASAQA